MGFFLSEATASRKSYLILSISKREREINDILQKMIEKVRLLTKV